MKAILVIDMPDGIDISKVRIGGDGNIYFIREGERASIVGNIKNIKPMPEKKQHKEEIDYEYGYIDGWNECLREIVNESNISD